MSKKIFYILIGFLLLNISISSIVLSDEKQIVDKNNFNLSRYKEIAFKDEKHILELTYKNENIEYSDINYKLVGTDKDIKVFNRCVTLTYRIVGNNIVFEGDVVGYGVYNVDVQPIIKGTILSEYAWFNSSYHKVMNGYVDLTQVPCDLTNFPILINISQNESLYTYTNGTDIDDILVVLENTTECPFEIDYYSKGGGVVDAWIWANLSYLNGSSMLKQNISIYYNCTNPDQDNEDIVNTWDSDYICIAHMSDVDGSLTDSTINSNDLSEDVSNPPLVGDYGITGTPVGIGVDIENGINWDIPTLLSNGEWEDGFTCEFWYSSDSDTTYMIPLCFIDNQYTIIDFPDDGGTRKNRWYTKDDGNVNNLLYGSAVQFDTWTSLAFYYDGTNKVLFENGINFYTSVEASLKDGAVTNDLGAYTDDGSGFDGRLDEFRISNVDRDICWLTTSYNTIANSSSSCPNPFIVWYGVATYEEPEEPVEDVPISFTVILGNSTDSCPCCISLCYNISTTGMSNVTLNSNYTGSWLPMQSFTHMSNGRYCFIVYNWTRYDFTYWFNYTYNNGVNFSYTPYYYVKTDTYNGCLNMEIELSINLLGLLFAIFVFYIAFRIEDERSNIWKPILFFLDVPICLAVGIVYLGNNVNSIGWWMGIFMFGFAIILSFGGLYYSLMFGRSA